MIGGAILTLDLDSGTERRYEVGRSVGCIVLREDNDGVLLGLQEGFGSLDVDTGKVTMLAPVGHDVDRMQLNDGACDPAGRFFAGSIANDGSRGAGVLYCYEPPGRARAALRGIGVSNGMAWDSTGTTFFFVDSANRRVDRFRYDPARATLSDRRPAFALDHFEGILTGSRSMLTTACG